jgi:hypothetical protein
MTELFWELFIGGLLLYGLVSLVVGAVAARSGVGTIETPDQEDAPIFVRRRTGRASTATVTTRGGTVVRVETSPFA